MELWSLHMNASHYCGLIPPAFIGVCVCFVPAYACAECVSMHPVKTGNKRMIACFLVSSGADLTGYKHCSLVRCMHAYTHTHTHTIFSTINCGCNVNRMLNHTYPHSLSNLSYALFVFVCVKKVCYIFPWGKNKKVDTQL